MGAIERITAELPEEVAQRLRARVAAGEFASESEAIVGALHGLDGGFENDPAFQAWLRGPVAEAYDEVSAGTAEILIADKVRESLTPQAEVTVRVVLTRRFRDQLDAIELWVAEREGADVATDIGDGVLARCQSLTNFPRRGTPHDEIRERLRTIPHERRYTIGYRVDLDPRVVALFHRPGELVLAIAVDEHQLSASAPPCRAG